MAQVLVFGASTAYGVGGSQGGWPDLLKRKLHNAMYAEKSLPMESHEVYNLCVPGATISDIEKRFTIEVEGYSKGRKLIIVIEVGGNDAKAADEPGNYVNTPENFAKDMRSLITHAKSYTDNILVVGLQPVDESKNNPRTNPNTGRKTYWTGERMYLFEQASAQVAAELGVGFVPVFDNAAELNRQGKFLCEDGLHPSDIGHEWLFEQIWTGVEGLI